MLQSFKVAVMVHTGLYCGVSISAPRCRQQRLSLLFQAGDLENITRKWLQTRGSVAARTCLPMLPRTYLLRSFSVQFYSIYTCSWPRSWGHVLHCRIDQHQMSPILSHASEASRPVSSK